ncbi:hypothetical protein FNN08_00980 [Thalassomonas sp. M1454]|nr:hypothetical protein FNN08_00980 [Thalassomonas sp. M1454]
MQSAKLFANLPDNCPTPDALAIAPDGSLTLSCPNFANNNLQGELLSINSKGEVSHLATVPTLELKHKANPMGIAYDEDGALYVADSRGIKNGRVLKLTFSNDKKLSKTEVIATGINPNGLRIHNDAVYITQLKMPKVKSKKMTSGIYRFNVNDRNLKMNNTLDDKHLIFYTETENSEVDFGLDGIAFDSSGDLYTAVLGDSVVFKLSLNEQGEVSEKSIFATLPNTTRVDGIIFDEFDNLYLAGFGLNQIFKIDAQQNLTKLADYPDNNGANGQIDQPADLMVFDNKLIISNFDLMKGNGIRNTKHSKPYTLSYIDLQ